MMSKIYYFLESNNDPKLIYKLIYFLFVPIFLILEIIIMNLYWKKIILNEFITNDTLYNFLDKNDFGLKFGKFYKKDLINIDLDSNDNEIIKYRINGEFINELSKLIEISSKIDIENYINITTVVEDKISKIKGEIFINKIYLTEIRFCRYYFFKKAIKDTIKYCLSIFLIAISIYFYLKFWI